MTTATLRRNGLLAASKDGRGAKAWTEMQKQVAEIIDAAQQGDRGAHYELYQRYHQRVYRLLVRMVGRQDAADLTQQTFLQAFRKLHQFCRQSQFGTWLHRLASNEALQHLRRTKRARERVLEQEPVDRSTNPCEKVAQDDLLDRALNLLEPDLRATFLLREIDGLSYREIAEVLQIPEGTVGSRMNRARRELKQHLLNLGWPHS